MARSILRFFARVDLFFYAVLWLIFLLIMGTLTQKDIGLYLAQERYFSSAILWLGGYIPTPGGYSIMAFITLGLFSKLLLQKWKLSKIGTIIVHIGVLLLLVGGFLTAAFSTEGNMVIAEGKSSNYFSDYHQRELVISGSNDKHPIIITQQSLEKNGEFSNDDFTLKVTQYYSNTKLVKREQLLDDGKARAMSKAIDMQEAAPMLNNEENISGLKFTISHANDKNLNGSYSIFENMPIKQHLETQDNKYLIEIRKKRTYLPFSIKLLDFEKTIHPNTNMAKSYSSDVILQDGIDKNLNWRSKISMNSPLRYKGYTFFQSSFITGAGKEITVLAVVKNIGRMFPYISSIVICFGILIHIIQRIFAYRAPINGVIARGGSKK